MTDYNQAVQPGQPINVNYKPASGDSPSMSNDNPRSQYAQRQYSQPPMTVGPMAGMSTAPNSTRGEK